MIPIGWAVGLAGFLLVVGFGTGVVFGLWFGERGRRKDVQWYAGLRSVPDSIDEEPDYVPAKSADADALERMEVAAMMEGLRQEAARDGIQVTDAELAAEAHRIVSQYHVEPVAGE